MNRKRETCYIAPVLPRNEERKINPDKLKELASLGHTRAEIAKILNFHYPKLCSKIHNSVTLTNAFNEGKKLYKESLRK